MNTKKVIGNPSNNLVACLGYVGLNKIDNKRSRL